GQATEAPEPAERPLHNPAMRLHPEASLLIRTLDDLDRTAQQLAHLLDKCSAIGSIGPDERQARQRRGEQAHGVRAQPSAVPDLPLGARDDHLEHKALRVDQQMPPTRPLTCLWASEPRGPPVTWS